MDYYDGITYCKWGYDFGDLGDSYGCDFGSIFDTVYLCDPPLGVGRRAEVRAGRRRGTKRRRSDPTDVMAGSWYRMLNNPDTAVAGTMNYKKFIRRFRMPLSTFKNKLVPLIKKYGIFKQQRQSKIPMEIKIMVGLRILGRGNCMDDISELTGLGETTCNEIFREFIDGLGVKMFSDFVYMPKDKELEAVMQQ